MWTNRYTTPSNEEVEATKVTLFKLKGKLVEAREALTKAQMTIDLLEQELEERSSWISPARLLPYDILSIIALEACRQDWKTLFRFGGVCRKWRQSILDTPQAWSLVHWKHIMPVDAIRIILQRGAPYPLHIQIGEDFDHRLSEEVTKHLDRIHCLTLSYRCRSILRKPLSNLTKLTFTGDPISMSDPLMILDGNLFPKLRCLSIGCFMQSINTTPNHVFPPIEELSIDTREPNFPAWVIRGLSHQLTHLHVFYQMIIILYTPGDVSDIDFPRLRHLTIGDLSVAETSYWLFKAKTPVLNSYSELRARREPNIHADTKTVTQLFFAQKIDLHRFPQLREVTSTSQGIRLLMSCLEAEPEGWPALETLIYKYEQNLDIWVNAFSNKTGRNIYSRFMENAIPSRWALTALTSCGAGMECENSREDRK